MGNSIVFTTIKSTADNKVLEQDKDGYYKVNLGALNAFNSGGSFYTAEGVKSLINDSSSSLARRLKSGNLKAEVGHPQMTPGMTKTNFYIRNMKIDITNTCGHIRELILTPTNEPSGVPGQGNYILIEGWVKPGGIHGDALKKALDNPEENVAFSIRSFTSDKVVNGINIKKILQIVTWDWVNEPGIAKATKWKKLSIESREVCSMELDELMSEGGEINQCFNCSLESEDERVLTKELIASSTTANSRDNDILNKW